MVDKLLFLVIFIIAVAVGLGIGTIVLYCLWNLIISPFFGLIELTWMQCFGGAIAIWLIKILLK